MKIKNNILKITFIAILFLGLSGCNNTKDSMEKIHSEKQVELPKPDWDSNLSDIEPDAGMWYQQADNNEKAASNIGVLYSEKIKDEKKAIEWFNYSNSIKTNPKNLLNMAISYQNIQDYDNAIKYYNQAYLKNSKDAANDLGVLYKKLKDYKNAEIWFKKGIKRKNINSINNLAIFCHDILKDDERASAYLIALIDIKYSKELTLRFLKERWNLSDKTIKKGYELQLTMPGLPRRFTGELNLK